MILGYAGTQPVCPCIWDCRKEGFLKSRCHKTCFHWEDFVLNVAEWGWFWRACSDSKGQAAEGKNGGGVLFLGTPGRTSMGGNERKCGVEASVGRSNIFSPQIVFRRSKIVVSDFSNEAVQHRIAVPVWREEPNVVFCLCSSSAPRYKALLRCFSVQRVLSWVAIAILEFDVNVNWSSWPDSPNKVDIYMTANEDHSRIWSKIECHFERPRMIWADFFQCHLKLFPNNFHQSICKLLMTHFLMERGEIWLHHLVFLTELPFLYMDHLRSRFKFLTSSTWSMANSCVPNPSANKPKYTQSLSFCRLTNPIILCMHVLTFVALPMLSACSPERLHVYRRPRMLITARLVQIGEDYIVTALYCMLQFYGTEQQNRDSNQLKCDFED